MAIEEIITETSKDNNIICKVKTQGKWQYLYSKYEPIKQMKIPVFEKEKDTIVMGIGMGYELIEIFKSCENRNIFVIDTDDRFYNIAKQSGILKDSKNVKYLFNKEYQNIDIDISGYQIVKIENITKYNNIFFDNAFNTLKEKQKKGKSLRIAFFEHITIADDCIFTLKKMGHTLQTFKWVSQDGFNGLIKELLDFDPDFIFTINFERIIATLCNKLNIKYISWTVDTPNYSFFYEEVMYPCNYIFEYEQSIVNQLKNMGVKNVYYMPVAANMERFDNIQFSSEDAEKYGANISFLGTTIRKNEYNTIYEKMNADIIKKIEYIFKIQGSNFRKYLIEENVTDDIVQEIMKLGNFVIPKYLDKKKLISIIIARKYDEIMRWKMVEKISSKHEIKVYGDKSWEDIPGTKLIYGGYAEHFLDMPKVFKYTKININLTRSYCESGLPMRVFDIMGCGGFMLTNHKPDIEKLFIDGEDLVIYNDFDDMMDKIEYYLKNESMREIIAKNGCEKIRKFHTYEERLRQILMLCKYIN